MMGKVSMEFRALTCVCTTSTKWYSICMHQQEEVHLSQLSNPWRSAYFPTDRWPALYRSFKKAQIIKWHLKYRYWHSTMTATYCGHVSQKEAHSESFFLLVSEQALSIDMKMTISYFFRCLWGKCPSESFHRQPKCTTVCTSIGFDSFDHGVWKTNK